MTSYIKTITAAIVVLCSAAAMSATAQNIKSGSEWNVGSLDYTAEVNADNTITFTAMAEGEELAFLLTPIRGKSNDYTIGEAPDGTFNFFESTHATYIEQKGWKLICLYDEKEMLRQVLDGTQTIAGEKVAIGKWMQQIMGRYIDNNGNALQIGWETINKDDEQCATYRNITFNGTVTGIIEITGPADMAGRWEIVQTLEGLTLYQVEPDEYGLHNRTGKQQQLRWADNGPRFGYAGRLLLNDDYFRLLDKPTLRIMRNEILAHHGYVLSSPDLDAYFRSQPWYSPRPSNNDVFGQLSLIEKLNVELIRAEEANKDTHEQ